MAMTIFPTSPTNGQTFVQGIITYTYDSTTDQWVGSSGIVAAATSAEVIAGTATDKYTSPAGLKAALQSSANYPINVAGTLTVGGVSTLGPVGNVKITGGTNGQVLTTDGTGTLAWATVSGGGGGGDVLGPSTAVTDNAVVRFDATTGKLIQNSVVVIGDTGAVTGVTNLTTTGAVTVGGVSTLGPVGNVKITGGTTGQLLSTDGTGVLSWKTVTTPTTGVITGTAAYDYQVAATAPTTRSTAAGSAALIDGDQWFDTTANVLKTRKTGVWVSPSSGPTTGVITGTAAQDYQTAATAPTTRSVAGLSAALVEGDLWYDTTKDTLMIRSGAGTWLSANGGGGPAVTTDVTYTTVFGVGNAGTQWYDLAQHGPGMYEVNWFVPITGVYYMEVINYDGTTTAAVGRAARDGNNDTIYSFPVGASIAAKVAFLIPEAVGSGLTPVARYVGTNMNPSTNYTKVTLTTGSGTGLQPSATASSGGASTFYIVRIRKYIQ